MGGAAREKVRCELTLSGQDWQGLDVLGVSRFLLERMVANALGSVNARGSKTPTYGKGMESVVVGVTRRYVTAKRRRTGKPSADMEWSGSSYAQALASTPNQRPAVSRTYNNWTAGSAGRLALPW